MATPSIPTITAPTTSDVWARFYLNRLRRLVALKPAPGLGFDADRLRSRAIYACFLECRQVGLGAFARTLLQAGETSDREVTPA